MKEILSKEIDDHHKTIDEIDLQQVVKIAYEIYDAHIQGNKILVFGNGGSASDAQHFTTELMVRYKSNRKSIGAIALTTDTSALTAISNDFSFEEVFSRQVEGLSNAGDIVFGISTSGTSKNVINGLKIANEKDCKTFLLTGPKIKLEGTEVISVCDTNTARVQEAHILIIHLICEILDKLVEKEDN